MKSSVASSELSAQKVVAQIRKVRKAAEKASESHRRFADYRYLRAVLRAYRYFDDNNLLPHLLETAPSLLMTPVRADWHPLRVIIEATCLQPECRVRSRWTRGLEYAVGEGIDPKELSRFIRAHNGIAGCADLASKTRPKRNRYTPD
ncbi:MULTISPECIES: hypothetical protein [Bradyrhizobium]|uniref:hypothetical protein n=1 Tax=Bradyrhizobium TaxID=374 RepID=UPI0012FD9F22|nr:MULTISPECIES: hypothetical protein [Bradyrhizobium]MBR1030271.1 hypothetical protein [Bradyrhizobium liaoningense]MDI2077562.1 hypothetical protein [Bradyrhizobium sp. Mp27]